MITALASLMLAAMTPGLEVLRRGMGRGLPVLLIALFFILAGIAALTCRPTDEIPRLVSLQYLHDFDAGRAFWVTPTAPPDPWLETIAGGGWHSGHPQPEYARSTGAYSFREAPVSSLTPPEVRVVEDELLSGGGPSASPGFPRVLTLKIISPRGGRRVTVTVKADNLEAAAIDGRPLELIPENRSGFAAVFLNPGPEGFELTLKTAAAPISLTVRESNPELPDLPDFYPPPPPPGVRLDRRELLLSKTFVFPPPILK
jgi:hypothetical protein